MQGQLLPENFLDAARSAGYDELQVRVRRQEGYDHSYYFVRVVDFTSFTRTLSFWTLDLYVRY